MKGRSIWSWVLLTLFVVLPLVLAANLAVEPQHVAQGKAATLPLSDEMDAQQELAQPTELFGVQTISHQFNRVAVECNDADCRQFNIFNFDESAIIPAIVNVESPTAITVSALHVQHNDQSIILLWGLGSLLAMGIALTRIYAVQHKQ